MKKYNVAVIGYGWAATAHIAAINATKQGQVTPVWSSQFRATKAAIDAGLVGTLHYGEVDYFHGIGPWYGQYRWNTKRELGGSALLTAGCHALDALLLCMGGEVEEVTSYAAQSSHP